MEREVGSIEREVRVAAPPDVVYEVLSTPEHLALWWSDDAVLGEVQDAVLEPLSPSERTTLLRLLRKIGVSETRPRTPPA